MKNIAVLMGGYSDESVISMKSGQVVYDFLDDNKYHKYKAVILKEEWYIDFQGEKYPINKADFSFTKDNTKITFDAVFNIIHGSPGEDGMVQAYFEMIGIKHTSCPFYQSALTFNKKDSLAVLNKSGIKSATSFFIDVNENYDLKAISTKVGIPCFVKPNKSGSSLGASKVNKIEELQKAIDFAAEQDNEVIVESFLEGVEVSVGVIDYKNETLVLGITEIVSDNEFFDYEAKYEGKSQEITPARISPEEEAIIREQSKKVYEVLNMKGLSRSEFILVKGVPYFLEMNTNPGLSLASILPKQAKVAGISLGDLFDDMIEKALKS